MIFNGILVFIYILKELKKRKKNEVRDGGVVPQVMPTKKWVRDGKDG